MAGYLSQLNIHFWLKNGLFCSNNGQGFYSTTWFDKGIRFPNSFIQELDTKWHMYLKKRTDTLQLCLVCLTALLTAAEKRNFVTKIVLTYCERKLFHWSRKNFWNSRLKAENLQNVWDHLNNSFKQWKFRTISVF